MRAVLFDLDGTLLDIEINSFLRRYFAALGPVVAEVVGDEQRGLTAVMDATGAMMAPHPGLTNAQRFAEAFTEFSGVTLTAQHWESFDRFYSEVFPTLQGDIGPNPGACDAVEAARAAGFKVVVATNPIFPLAAIRERIAWACLADVEFDYVTSYETSRATKPHGQYYLEIAQAISVEPSECLMVGDDRSLDMPAADVGMRTFYVGHGPSPSADFSGNLFDVADLLHRLPR